MLPGFPANLNLTFLKSQRRFLPQPYKKSSKVREIRFELTGDGNFISVRVDGHGLRCKDYQRWRRLGGGYMFV